MPLFWDRCILSIWVLAAPLFIQVPENVPEKLTDVLSAQGPASHTGGSAGVTAPSFQSTQPRLLQSLGNEPVSGRSICLSPSLMFSSLNSAFQMNAWFFKGNLLMDRGCSQIYTNNREGAQEYFHHTALGQRVIIL